MNAKASSESNYDKMTPERLPSPGENPEEANLGED